MTLADLDKRHLWHPFTQMGRWANADPLIIERGEGNYLIDTEGNRYLDGVSSLWTNVHGHRRAEIDAAIRSQLERIGHSTLLGLSNVPAIELAKELTRVAPRNLTRVFYSDSGSTAAEVALKMAFQYWQLVGRKEKTRFVALDQAYHGDTVGAVSVGGIDLFHRIFHPLLFQCERITMPHPYRASGVSEDDPERCRESCLAELSALLETRADEIAAMIVEPRVQGAAGIVVHPRGYLKGAAALCRQHDVLLICDEVATGFGRTGPLFSCEAEGVEPDLMAVAKGLSGGYLPLAATLTSDRIFEAFVGKHEQTFFHGHTYTGNPLACAAAIASLRLIETSDLLTQTRARAEVLSQLLEERISTHVRVGEVRQLGLMVGVELVADRERKTPYPATQLVGHNVCMAIRKRGVVLRNLGDVVVIMPPLSIHESELDTLVAALAETLDETLVD